MYFFEAFLLVLYVYVLFTLVYLFLLLIYTYFSLTIKKKRKNERKREEGKHVTFFSESLINYRNQSMISFVLFSIKVFSYPC